MIKLESPIYFSGKGKRDVNEDFVFPEKPDSMSDVFMVCDGLGGMVGGEIASKLTGLAVYEYLSGKQKRGEKELVDSIEYANSLILNFTKRFPKAKGMATTLAMLSKQGDQFYASWVGDSRIYQIRNGQILFQSKDHSYRQLMIDKGLVDEDDNQNNHIITQAIGGNTALKPSVEKIDNIENGDYFVLVTDGILEAFTEKAFHSYFDGKRNNQEIVTDIVSLCESSSKDNFSMYVFKAVKE